MITVLLNGESRALPEGSTAADAVVVAGASGDGRGVAVALDGHVVPRGQWRETPLTEGKQVEVLQAVQGG